MKHRFSESRVFSGRGFAEIVFRSVLVLLPVLAGMVRADEFELTLPSGNYQGPLEIPAISRFVSLPMRMDLEPKLVRSGRDFSMNPQHISLFDKVLRESGDSELLETAALSILRIVKYELEDVSSSLDVIAKHMKETKSIRMRQICAQVLAQSNHQESAGDLLEFCRNAGDGFQLSVEPALIRWKYAPAEEVWLKRLENPNVTQTAMRLACEGLAALKTQNSLSKLNELLRNKRQTMGKRLSAAKAIADIDPALGAQEASAFRNGAVHEKLLGVSLLSNRDPKCLEQLVDYLHDPSLGVAAAAWKSMQQMDSARLVEHLDKGRKHEDAGVRMVSAQVIQQFPDAQRCVWLSEMISDYHLEVRNQARRSLVTIADNNAELRQQIRSAAESRIEGDPKDWQGIEQSLVILGQLFADGNSARCVPLMSHDRAEVRVTAAWLLHLFPDEAVLEPMLDWLHRCEAAFEGALRHEDVSKMGIQLEFAYLQMAHIIQLAGLLRAKGEQQFLEKNFNMNGAVGGSIKRSAAMWAMGLINEDSGNQELAGKYTSRILQRNTMPEEALDVRQKSVLGLGMIRSVPSEEIMTGAYQLDPPPSLIPQAARWSLARIAKPVPPPVPAEKVFIGGWKLNPISGNSATAAPPDAGEAAPKEQAAP